jgi:hypothetical protein
VTLPDHAGHGHAPVRNTPQRAASGITSPDHLEGGMGTRAGAA